MNIKSVKLCILGGGWSNEREISLRSSGDVYQCLKANGHDVVFYDMEYDSPSELEKFLKDNSINLVFNLIHGEGGEDGKMQAYLDSFNVPYCGSNASSSFISFNKHLTKKKWIDNKLITPRYEIYDSQNYKYCSKTYGDKFFIKDTCSGSSNNIYYISSEEDYRSFSENYNTQREYIIEEKIDANEYTAAILNKDVLPIIKIVSSNTFYDYDAKYKSDQTKFIFPDLSKEITEKIQYNILTAFNSLGCKDWARVDFFIKNNKVILLEINTIPGMTDHSLVPKAASKYGISYYELILKILNNNV
tara:strand:- start:5299 stop:6207 length:909 start_codon:yes stop_codon:yes gene_type:complete